MIIFKETFDDMSLDQLYQELGMADFAYLETNQFIERLEQYRYNLHQKIKEKHEPNSTMGTRDSNTKDQ